MESTKGPVEEAAGPIDYHLHPCPVNLRAAHSVASLASSVFVLESCRTADFSNVRKRKKVGMSAPAKSTSYWADAMESDGFVVECGRRLEGEVDREWFSIISREPSMFAGLHQMPTESWPRKTSSPINAKDYWFSEPLSESDVRSKLLDAGLSASDIDTKLEWARQWATTFTRRFE